MIDKYAELKISSIILGFKLGDYAKRRKTSIQVIRDVCMGYTTSARLQAEIETTIARAEQVWKQHLLEKKKQAETNNHPKKDKQYEPG